MSKVNVRFMTLSGKFATVYSKDFNTVNEAQKEVEEYVKGKGFTDVKFVDDEEFDGGRFTATTAQGRKGRNVAFLDWITD